MKKKRRSPLLSFLIFAAAAAVVIPLGILAYNTALTVAYPQKYSELVEKYGAEYSIEENLLYAVIRTESGFDPAAESSAGARGLTQITEDTFNWLMSKTGETYSFDAMYDPEVAIKYGALFLSILQEEFRVTPTMAAAYHAGMSRVAGWLNDPLYSDDGENLKDIPISDTRHYVNKITAAVDKYNSIYG